MTRYGSWIAWVCTMGIGGLGAETLFAQAATRAVFVGNNGNLEGSLTAFTIDDNGRPQFVNRVITGTRPNTSVYEPGTNTYSIAISPNGRWLASGHASSDDPLQQTTIYEVAADASVTIRGEFPTPDTALDIGWISDTRVVATRTEVGAQNQLLVYDWDEAANTLTQVGFGNTGTFTSSLAVHPGGQYVYGADSGSTSAIYVFHVEPDGTLTPLQTVNTPTYPLGAGVSPDGTKLYANGGISGGGHAVIGYHIGPDGRLTAMAGSPFFSPGSSPKDVTFTPDTTLLFVAHGTDATVRSFTIDALTGAITSTGFFFDVGLQGSLGDAVVLNDLLLVTDNTTAIDGVMGLYSFAIQPNGNFTSTGPIVSTQGIAPTEIAAWSPPPSCPGDFDGDRQVGLSDLTLLLSAYGHCTGDPEFIAAADFDADGCIGLADLTQFLALYGANCP